MTKTKQINWRVVFNCNFKMWGDIIIAQFAAKQAEYPYFIWNDRVYDTATGEDTGYQKSDLDNHFLPGFRG